MDRSSFNFTAKRNEKSSYISTTIRFECYGNEGDKIRNWQKKLPKADVIIWKKASMIPKKAFEIAEKTLQDISCNHKQFENK